MRLGTKKWKTGEILYSRSYTISVAIAACKGEKYIREQLLSIMTQTRAVNEIVISDDSPDERTKNIISATTANWTGKIVYIKNSVPLGVVKNFQQAVQRAGGDLIFLCDQDDVWEPEKVEIMEKEFIKFPYCQVAACSSKLIDLNAVPLGRFIPENHESALPLIRAINAQHGFPAVVSGKFSIPGHAMVLRRSFRVFFLKMPLEMKQHDLWLIMISSLFEVFRFVDIPLTDYRVHPCNLTDPLTRKTKPFSLQRLSEIVASSNDITETCSCLLALKQCKEVVLKIPERNSVFLDSMIQYFQQRVALREKTRFLRLFHLSGKLLFDYFKLGTGWCTLTRDLFF